MNINQANPFCLPNPSVVSFSGGRTSGYMLYQIVQAFGGKLPDWVKVIFCNTGIEREETYDFIERCSQRWDVPILWLEYTYSGKSDVGKAKHGVRVVDYSTASRNGEPFLQIVQARQAIPNIRMRFCTGELKIRTTSRYVRGVLGWKEYHNAIGLRADEPNRVGKIRLRIQEKLNKGKLPEKENTLFGVVNKERKKSTSEVPPGEWPLVPLYDSRRTHDDVKAFWISQDFDLGIPSEEGNCSLCFLKKTSTIIETIRKHPELADIWIHMESLGLGRKSLQKTFRLKKDRPPYAELKRIALETTEDGGLFDQTGISCECRCTD